MMARAWRRSHPGIAAHQRGQIETRLQVSTGNVHAPAGEQPGAPEGGDEGPAADAIEGIAHVAFMDCAPASSAYARRSPAPDPRF